MAEAESPQTGVAAVSRPVAEPLGTALQQDRRRCRRRRRRRGGSGPTESATLDARDNRPSDIGRPSKRGAAAAAQPDLGEVVTSSPPEEGVPASRRTGSGDGDRGPGAHRDRGRASSRRRGSGERSRSGRSAGSPFAAFSASAMAASRRAVPARSRCTQTDPQLCCCASYPPATANGDRSWFLEGPLRPSAPPLPPATSADLSLLRLAEPPDVRLVVGPEAGDTRSFQVHSAVLKHSAVLEDQLGRCTRECDDQAACDGPENNSLVAQQATRTLRVIWDDPDVFEKMILSLYGRDVPLEDVSYALELLRVSHAFAVPGLLSGCLRYVGEHVDRESALSALTRLCEVSGGGAAVDLQQNLLNETRARCLDVVDRHAERLLAAADFERLPRELVCLVLARDTLWLRSEMSAAEGADRWAAAECRRRGEAPNAAQKRRVLGDAAYLVRHFRLDRDQFRRAPALLGDSEAALVVDFMDGRIREEQLTPALRNNLAMRQRPSLPSPLALPASSPPVDTEHNTSANGRLRSQTLARTRKSTSAKVRKCAAEVFWTFVSILD